jgi:Tol biopolymer transport system component
VVTRDGRYIVYASNRGGKRNLWRIDSDGLNPLRLTSGAYEDFPFITPDDNWVVYRTGGEIRRISINGGEPTRLFEKIGTYCALSADGRFLALFASEGMEQPVWHVDVHDIANGYRVKRFNLPSGTEPFRDIAWSPDHSGITYVRTTDGAANIWLQPNSAEPPRQLTSFKEGEIASFSWSTDGQEIYCVRNTKAYIALMARFFQLED